MRLMDKEMANEIDDGDVDPFEDETRQLDRQRAGVGPVPNDDSEPQQNQENVSTFKRVKAIRSRQTQLAEDIE